MLTSHVLMLHDFFYKFKKQSLLLFILSNPSARMLRGKFFTNFKDLI